MRQDVKLGVLVALGIVLVAGGYYLFRGKSEVPIPVNPGGPLQSQAAKDKPATTPTTPRTADRPTAPRTVPGSRTASPAPSGTSPASQPGPVVPTPARPAATSPGVASTTSPSGAASNAPLHPVSTPMTPPTGGPSGSSLPGSPGASPAGPAEPARQADASPSSSPPSPPTAETSPSSGTAPTTSPVASAEGPETKPSNTPNPPAGPAAVPARPGEVDSAGGATESYRVQEGDTYPSLAMMFYGDSRYTSFLMRNNPHITGGRLQPGQVVKIPPLPTPSNATRPGLPPSVAGTSTPGSTTSSTPAQAAPVPSGTATAPSGTPLTASAQVAAETRNYQVREGDSFYAIARDVLGDATRWQEVFELNRDAVKGDPKRLRIGQTIRLPAS